jgi:hypothetical protein
MKRMDSCRASDISRIQRRKFPEMGALERKPWALISIVVLVVTMAAGFSSNASATTIQTAVVSCAGCASAGDLLAAGTSYFTQYSGQTPPGYTGTIGPSASPLCTSSTAQNGTYVLVVSALYPISEFFYECLLHTGTGIGTFTMVVKPADSGANADAIANDALLIARSAKTGPITLPTDITLTGDPQETISAYLSSAAGVPQNGTSVISLWHGITNFPQAIQGTFVNTETGETFTLWNGDTIIVTDSNGDTAKFQWTPLSSIQWTLVPGSIRDKNGNPIGQTSTPASAAGPSVAVTLPDQQTSVITPYQAQIGDPPLPKGTVTLDPDVGITGTQVVCWGGGACVVIPGL